MFNIDLGRVFPALAGVGIVGVSSCAGSGGLIEAASGSHGGRGWLRTKRSGGGRVGVGEDVGAR